MIQRSLRAVLLVVAFTAAAVFVAVPARAETPKDFEWWLGAMRMAEVHEITQGDGVVVGVVDSGIDGNHPALAGQVLQGSGIKSGSPDGWGAAVDDHHGTGMAGLIAGHGSDYLGIAPKAKILPYAVPVPAHVDQTAAGIRWLAEHGAKVINVSLAGAASQDETDAVKYALDRDVVVVAGAGNVDQTGATVGSPASVPGVIAVSAMDRKGYWWTGSAQGPEVVLSAPGVKMVAPAPRSYSSSGYARGTGTSDASAIVSGVAALVRAKFPNLKAPAVVNRLIETSRDNGPAGRDPQFGIGTVRAYNALTDNVPEVTGNPLGTPTASGGGPSPSSVATSPAAHGSVGRKLVVMVVVVLVVVGGLIGLVAMLAWRRRRQTVPEGPYGGRPGAGPGAWGPPDTGPPGWGPPGWKPPPVGQPYTGTMPPAGQPYGTPAPPGGSPPTRSSPAQRSPASPEGQPPP